jgi:hypothetical protein
MKEALVGLQPDFSFSHAGVITRWSGLMCCWGDSSQCDVMQVYQQPGEPRNGNPMNSRFCDSRITWLNVQSCSVITEWPALAGLLGRQ